MPDRIALIVNPRAGRNRAGRELPALMQALDSAGTDYEVHTTKHRGHATELTTDSARSGFSAVIAVGGDGTVNEVVNGLMQLDAASRPSLGVVAAGSGADFARTFELPEHTSDGLRGVVGQLRPIDVGRLEFGDGTVRHFINIANVGLAASTVERAERLPRRLGKARYVIALWPVLARFRPCGFTVSTTAGTHTEVAHSLLVANGRYAGGGMLFSPHSEPDDGLFDSQMNIGPKRQAVTLIPKIFKGTHLPSDRIIQTTGNRFSIETDEPLLVEADGELLGHTPVDMTVLPRAIELIV